MAKRSGHGTRGTTEPASSSHSAGFSPAPPRRRPSSGEQSSAQTSPRGGPCRPTFLDLFCGCGGLTLGMLRAGFDCLAAIDFNPQAISTLKANLLDRPHPVLPPVRNALERDLTQYPPWELAALLGTDRVDVIVGGPPCQGFSTARRRDGANHGQGRMVHDARRSLYQQFLRYVDHFYPKVFVMENVLGIRSAAGGEYFTRVQKEARQLGYRVHSQMEDAWKLGVPQKRRRQLIIGTRQDLPEYFRPGLQPAPHAMPEACLGAAIGDLPVLRAGQGEDEREYDMQRRRKNLRKWKRITSRYLHDVLEIGQARLLTNHVARPHSDRDLRDFARLREGESSTVAMRDRGVKFEFPYDKSHFKDRYTRQSRFKPCSTIVSQLRRGVGTSSHGCGDTRHIPTLIRHFRPVDSDGELLYEGIPDGWRWQQMFASLGGSGKGFAGCMGVRYLTADR